MAGVLNWALEGAARLVKQDRFSASRAHERTMREWRLRSDSVAAFMEAIGFKLLRQYKQKHNSSMPTPLFYDEYELYCNQERTKPVGKKTCFERIRSIDGVAIKHFEDGDKLVML
jgi:putative DNA primase/helicase